MADTKVCSKCKVEKKLDEFQRSNRPGGYQCHCKKCRSKWRRYYYKRNKELIADNQRRYHRIRRKDSQFLLLTALRNAKYRAIKRKIEFNIDLEWLLRLYKLQDQRCAITGLRFRNEKIGRSPNPGSISLHRINSRIGYTKGNTIIVCWWVNMSLSTYTISEISRYVKALSKYMRNSSEGRTAKFKVGA